MRRRLSHVLNDIIDQSNNMRYHINLQQYNTAAEFREKSKFLAAEACAILGISDIIVASYDFNYYSVLVKFISDNFNINILDGDGLSKLLLIVLEKERNKIIGDIIKI